MAEYLGLGDHGECEWCGELIRLLPHQCPVGNQQAVPEGWCQICGGRDYQHKPGCEDGSEIL